MPADIYPIQVEVNEANILKITRTFKSAYADILEEIEGATNFGVANRKAILKQIEQVLSDLGTDVQKFIEKELPKYYKSGADDAVKQLRNTGADVSVSEGFNRVHKDAIVALVDETAEAFGESMTGVNRSARLLLGKAVREAITQRMATSVISGDALRDIKLMIVGLLKQQGLSALVDKGGHTWTLDRYAEMLFRTKAVEARNRGLANRMVENNYDLVQVSSHGTDHEACAVWEGKILSVSGKNAGYPTVAEAELSGLFHPNCKHAINVLIPSLASKTRAYDPNTKTLTAPGQSVTKPLSKQLEPLAIAADSYDPKFKMQVIKIAESLGVKSQGGPVKSLPRATEKILGESNGQIDSLMDWNRSVLLIDDPKRLDAFVEGVKKEFEVVRVKSNLTSKADEYKKALINVKMDNGLIGEIQVATPEMWRAKTELGGDALYHVVRVESEGWQELRVKMEQLYREADAMATARLKAS